MQERVNTAIDFQHTFLVKTLKTNGLADSLALLLVSFGFDTRGRVSMSHHHLSLCLTPFPHPEQPEPY